ncbi:MAG: cation diffusion facilitator family transporter [Coprobacillus sp.]
MKEQSNESIALKVSLVTIIGNVILTVFKLIAGFVGHSSAMISDAIHSGSDVLSTLVVIVGVKLSNKKSDIEHPYGHERLECVAAIILAIMLAVTGAGIGISGINMMFQDNTVIPVPSTIALVAAIISIIVKEAMYWYTYFPAKKMNSGALLADAWHHRSDALSSIGSFAGILGAQLGFKFLDPLASVVISLFILKVSYDIFKDSINKMIDKSCDKDVIQEIEDIIYRNGSVKQIDDLKTRLFGDKIYVDVEIAADADLTLLESHQVAQDIHDLIEKSVPLVKHCMIHMNPYIK